MIPKIITTCWLSEDNTIPELIQKCIESQKIHGYEFNLLTLDNIPKDIPYLNDAVGARKWVKATDFLRMYTLYNTGGIFLDADVEVIRPEGFEPLLDTKLFVGKENCQNPALTILATAVIGSVPKHPMIKEWMHEATTKFKGDDNLNYESSMDLLNLIGVKYQDKMTILDRDYFHPYDHNTNTILRTARTITFHHFLKSWVPENITTNQYETNLLNFKHYIENNINFTFVKRGDGELACMNGEQGGNCDGHPYSEKLGGMLKDAYDYLKVKGAMIVDFDNQRVYNTLLHRTDSNLTLVSDLYKAIKNSPRRKIFVGPERLGEMAKYLDAHHVVVPLHNVFSEYDSLLDKIKPHNNAIYIFCCGMPAKPLIANLLSKCNATFLDCGSAFDPLVGGTRTYQISREEFQQLYGMSNFTIPQDIHPERLYAVSNITGPVVYDVGCGSNKTVAYAVGIDVKPVANIRASGDRLYWIADNSADTVISRHSLEHILDPTKALKEWQRVLKPNGRLIIVLPDHEYINTLDPNLSHGEHMHAYTRDSFASYLSLFPHLLVEEQITVIKDWSFGTLIRKLPKLSFIIPTLGREEGLNKCIDSIHNLDYPQDLIEIIVDTEHDTVPIKVARSFKKSTGDWIVYAANDMEFYPSSIKEALRHQGSAELLAFNSGALLPDNGNICEHFMISRKLANEFGQIFDIRFHHVGVDNYLWHRALKINKAKWVEQAKIQHNHFSKTNVMDKVYEAGWSKVDEDRKLLAEVLSAL